MGGLHHAHRSYHPLCNLLDHVRILPMADYNLALNTHAAHNMTILAVTVRRLVLIHKVHINRVIWNLLVKLRMEMHQRLSVLLQAQNP